MPNAKQHILAKSARAHNLVVDPGPTDPEARTDRAAGVGACGPRNMPPLHSKAATETFGKFSLLGRGMRHLLAVGQGKVVASYNFYDWTGGHDNRDAAQRAHVGLSAIFDEADAQGDDFSCVMGDFNADRADLPTALSAMAKGWTDLGANPAWSQGGPEHTCYAHPSSPGTRRDFILCSPKLLPVIAGFRVYFHPTISTHAVLGVALRPRGNRSLITSFRTPRNMVPSSWESQAQEVAFRVVAQHAISEEASERQQILQVGGGGRKPR